MSVPAEIDGSRSSASSSENLLRFFGGEIRFPRFAIRYDVADNGGVVVWRSPQAKPALSFLRSPSGSGKTTFLSYLAGWLTQRPSNSLDFVSAFDLHPAAGHMNAVAHVPQNPPMVNHWRVSDIVPEPCPFLSTLFPAIDIRGKRIGELSGGQVRKLYTASALSRLSAARANFKFLLLDETFDGLGADEASERLSGIASAWTGAPLAMLVVTHLPTMALPDGDSVRIDMQVSRSEATQSTVTVRNI